MMSMSTVQYNFMQYHCLKIFFTLISGLQCVFHEFLGTICDWSINAGYFIFPATLEGVFSVWRVQGCVSGSPDASLNSFKASGFDWKKTTCMTWRHIDRANDRMHWKLLVHARCFVVTWRGAMQRVVWGKPLSFCINL